jgi:hypothetical protein
VLANPDIHPHISVLSTLPCGSGPVAVAVARTVRRRLSRSRPRCRTSTHWCRSDTVVATACAKRVVCSHVSVGVPNRPDAAPPRPSKKKKGTRTRRGCGIYTRTSGRRLTAWPLPHCLDAPHAFSPHRCCNTPATAPMGRAHLCTRLHRMAGVFFRESAFTLMCGGGSIGAGSVILVLWLQGWRQFHNDPSALQRKRISYTRYGKGTDVVARLYNWYPSSRISSQMSNVRSPL